MNEIGPEETGRYLIFFHSGGLSAAAAMARRAGGIEMPLTVEEAHSATLSGEWRNAQTVVVPSLNVAVCSADPEQMRRLETGNSSPIRHIREEYYFRIAASSEADANYLHGYRAGINAIVESLLRQKSSSLALDLETQDNPAFTDTAELTWGLQAIGLSRTALTGKGVRIAVLDTGLDRNHPDFSNRGIESRSFVEGAATAQDDNGHGTHCLGTVTGPKRPSQGPRYGVACEAQIFVGKVMDSRGKGREGDVLHGIGWALQNRCRVISMSFGKPVAPGIAPDSDYEEIGSIALSKNCLLIAAAGNDSLRPGGVAPVEIPANSRTFMAVGALNRRLAIYTKSNGGVNLDGGGVDLVGPGVDIRSSKRLPLVYGLDTGTSMATPHVAGVASLLMEADPSANAEQIWTRLTQNANRLPLSSTDVGAGLVQVE